MGDNIVVIGGGIAAISGIKAIREIDNSVNIHLIGEEKFYPYIRIKLSKSLFDKLEENLLLIQKKEWYEANNINLHIGVKVLRIDVKNHNVMLSDGSSLRYDKILLANGSENFTPPIEGIDKDGVFTLRTLQDAQNIMSSISNKNTIVNIGGGIQGLETVWILNQQGKSAAIAEIESRLMPRQLDKRASEILQKAIESFNIKIYLNTQVEKILGDIKVEGILTKDKKEINCDMVLYSTGIKPNIEVIDNTEISLRKGVIVDKKMETSIKGIYAAGDIAEFEGRVMGLWNIAIGQGKTAGYNIIGKETIYETIAPVTTLNAFKLSLFSMGKVDEEGFSHSIVQDNNDLDYKRVFIKDNKIIGAIIIGDTKKSPLIKTAIEKEILLENVEFGNITVDELLSEIKK